METGSKNLFINNSRTEYRSVLQLGPVERFRKPINDPCLEYKNDSDHNWVANDFRRIFSEYFGPNRRAYSITRISVNRTTVFAVETS